MKSFSVFSKLNSVRISEKMVRTVLVLAPRIQKFTLQFIFFKKNEKEAYASTSGTKQNIVHDKYGKGLLRFNTAAEIKVNFRRHLRIDVRKIQSIGSNRNRWIFRVQYRRIHFFMTDFEKNQLGKKIYKTKTQSDQETWKSP